MVFVRASNSMRRMPMFDDEASAVRFGELLEKGEAALGTSDPFTIATRGRYAGTAPPLTA